MSAVTLPDPIDLAKALIACESVTPARGSVFDVAQEALAPLGFAIDRFVSGDAPDGPVENMIAKRDGVGQRLAFAGHLDTVPPGEGWTSDAFTPIVRSDMLYGRGAVDMKGAVACFIAACGRVPDAPAALLLTGDEEGPATFGTVKLIQRLAERSLKLDLCLVGEPTSVRQVGDTIKIGRRGSMYLSIEVPGQQGHVAYPHLADNPIPKLVAALAELSALTLDHGNAWFQPSTLAITDVSVGNPTGNIIPGRATARLAIRFNDEQHGEALAARVSEIVRRHAPGAIVRHRVSGEAFLTPPGAFSALVSEAVAARTGLTPELSTSGGTSDARFLSRLCPTVELGLVNATMHKLDEAVALADLKTLTAIYADLLTRLAAGGAAQARNAASSIGGATA